MSSIGKVFVVLNLVFSLVILGVVGAILSQGQKYRTEFERVSAEYEDAQTKFDEEKGKLLADIQAHERDKTGLNENLNNKTVEVSTLTKEVEQAKADLRTAQQNLSNLESNVRAMTSNQGELQTNNKELSESNAQMISERNDAVDAQRAAEEDAARARAEVARLEATVGELRDQIDRLTAERGDLSAQIEAAVQAGFDISKVRAFPKIDGVVQSVNNDLGIVVLSVGRDDGVSRGAVFHVFNGQYKGKVIVEDVFPDNCSARIVPNSKGLAINVMDRATTRI